jgi:uncharacterized membrane protein YfcA
VDRVSVLGFVLLVLAGIGGGLTGSIAGLASLVSYPALLAVGLPPVTANVTNTVALVFTGIGSVWSSRPELAGERSRIVRLGVVAVLGGAVGGALLLVGKPGVFEKLVPLLIGGASAVILVPRSWLTGRPLPAETVVQFDQAPIDGIEKIPADGTVGALGRDRVGVFIGMFLLGIYGGYFGAAAGVVLLAVLLTAVTSSIAKANALKNALLGLANAVAALAFVAFGPVRWSAVVPLSIGFLVGGLLGPPIVRRVPAGPLRFVIALSGLGLAIWLGIGAYR